MGHPSNQESSSAASSDSERRKKTGRRVVMVVVYLVGLSNLSLLNVAHLSVRMLYPTTDDKTTSIDMPSTPLSPQNANATQKRLRNKPHSQRSYPFEFPTIENAQIKWWSMDDNKDEKVPSDCYLGSQWQFLGHGGTHFAFGTNYTCWDKGVWSPPRPIVVRLASRREFRPEKVRYYISMDNELKQGTFFRQQLQGDWTNEQIDRYFALPKGQVDIPKQFFLDFASTVMANGHVVGVDLEWTSAELSDFIQAQGDVTWHLGHTQFLSPPHRRLGVLQDLVAIFIHMRQQRTAHCDMHLGHVLVVEESIRVQQQLVDKTEKDFHLTMVDFEMSKTQITETIEMYQLWQLMGMIAVTCGSVNRKKDDYSVKSNICHIKDSTGWTDAATYESQILPDLQKCPFVKPLNWTRDLLTDIPKAYRTLSELVGFNSASYVEVSRN